MTVLEPRPLAVRPALDQETSVDIDEAADSARRFEELVARLSRQSVEKHFDAYADIPWDDPAFAVDVTDPRWARAVDDGLAETEWFRALPPETQQEMGLYLVASFMKIGLQFENILKRGLLRYALDLPNGDPRFRYAYHEVIEEGHHGMMFQEFVNRTGFDIRGLPRDMKIASQIVVSMGSWFPELFFMFVLGGEDPIDHRQRQALREKEDLMPIMERIMRIHVTEEARHLSFARHLLKQRNREMGPIRRGALAVGTPLILGVMAQLMMRPSPAMVKRFDIPDEVIREAYTDNPDHARRTVEAITKVRRLSRELGLVNPVTMRIWQGLGIWSDD